MKKYNVEAAMTFEEIAAVEGVSTQRAHELYNRGLKKANAFILKNYGSSVKLEDIFPILNKENIYEQMSCM
jgi:hypothetical protein